MLSNPFAPKFGLSVNVQSVSTTELQTTAHPDSISTYNFAILFTLRHLQNVIEAICAKVWVVRECAKRVDHRAAAAQALLLGELGASPVHEPIGAETHAAPQRGLTQREAVGGVLSQLIGLHVQITENNGSKIILVLIWGRFKT